jgi:hypothetical protein
MWGQVPLGDTMMELVLSALLRDKIFSQKILPLELHVELFQLGAP